jgi:hypothetical protein
MRSLSQMVGVLIGVLLLAFAGAALADDDDDDDNDRRAKVVSAAPTEVTAASAVLQGYVNPRGSSTTYVFEYGATAAYGAQSAPASAGSSESLKLVSTQIKGLQPGATYHYRVKATNSKGTTRGSDRAFTTLAFDRPPLAQGSEPPVPQLGSSVTVARGKGAVRVRTPGTSNFVALTAGSEVPVGSEVDTRRGTVVLTAALPSGKTQTGRFAGGRFKLRQNMRGYVDLYLRGRICPRRAATRPAAQGSTLATASRTRRRTGRRLWGRDRGGRFRTRGRNSHATVRGTRWLVADRCNGTLTRVTQGSVIVRDTARNKRVLVKAGERYLARPRR